VGSLFISGTVEGGGVSNGIQSVIFCDNTKYSSQRQYVLQYKGPAVL